MAQSQVPVTVPPVRYTRTPDGTTIAYMVAGEGPPVIFLPLHHNHLERRWTAPGSWPQRLANHYRLVAYDSRGQGLSSRDLSRDPSLGDYRSDLEAVISASGLRPSVLLAYGGFSHVALRYAVDNPELVDALVLMCTCESFSAWPVASMITLAKENWDLFLDLQLASESPEYREARIDFINAAASPGDYIRMVRAFSASNVSDVLDKVSVPVLVLHSVDQHWLSVEEGKKFASKVADARAVFVEGGPEPLAVHGVRAIEDFLGDLYKAEAVGGHDHVTVEDWRKSLSPRQAEVLRLISSGKTTREIADELALSTRTVERHIADVYAKLGVRNRAEATACALGKKVMSSELLAGNTQSGYLS